MCAAVQQASPGSVSGLSVQLPALAACYHDLGFVLAWATWRSPICHPRHAVGTNCDRGCRQQASHLLSQEGKQDQTAWT